jgi:twitching motility two-component system response regulator PilG
MKYAMTKTTKKIDGFSIDNILQIFSLEKKSQTLHVRKEDKQGFLDIDHGDLINAQLGNQQGIDAAIEILSWDDVQIELFQLRPCSQTITNSLINILLEVSKLKDERKSLFDESGEGLLASAIEKAEMQQYKESYKDLVQYLKINKNNAVAWVWYSRIQGNVGIMKKALNMAGSLDPENPLVKEEQQKFRAVSSRLTEDVARKCYFCWAPLNKNTTTCHYCRGHLIISREALIHSGEADATYLEQSKNRYSRILKKFPRSLTSIYCLGLVSVNSLNFQEALGYLDKAAKMAPEKALFANQLKLLLDHLAQHSTEVKAAAASPSATVVPMETTGEAADDQKLILVVEDSSTTRKVIAITLSRQGYRVIEAADGLEALSKISEERPDLIMLDVILPKMDGYKILSIIKGNKEFREIPVIMLTSKDGFINKMKGKMAGSSAYLTKPFDPDKMIAEIEKHI